jgi:hypothetical protein
MVRSRVLWRRSSLVGEPHRGRLRVRGPIGDRDQQPSARIERPHFLVLAVGAGFLRWAGILASVDDQALSLPRDGDNGPFSNSGNSAADDPDIVAVRFNAVAVVPFDEEVAEVRGHRLAAAVRPTHSLPNHKSGGRIRRRSSGDQDPFAGEVRLLWGLRDAAEEKKRHVP